MSKQILGNSRPAVIERRVILPGVRKYVSGYVNDFEIAHGMATARVIQPVKSIAMATRIANWRQRMFESQYIY